MNRFSSRIVVLGLFGVAALAGEPDADVILHAPEQADVQTSTPTAVQLGPIVLEAKPNNAFAPGEKLTFDIKYEFITAGTATMNVLRGPVINGRPTLHIESNAQSNGFVDSFFKVRDFNASTIDESSLYSLNFHQNLTEGGYRVIRNTSIDYIGRQYKFKRIRRETNKEWSGPINQPVFDILSAFFYTRTLPLELGQTYHATVFSDEDIYQLAIRVHPKLQKISVPAGKFECLRIEPAIIGDGIFQAKEGKMQIWLTNDERKMPVLIRSKVFIGAFDAQLSKFTTVTK